MTRFTDNGNGTVIDNLTGLMWLKDAGIIYTTWDDGLTQIQKLNKGKNFSAKNYVPKTYTDWRIPNLNEFESMRDMTHFAPPISNRAGNGKWTNGDPFVKIKHGRNGYGHYWTSTALGERPTAAWYILLQDGSIGRSRKTYKKGIWPVRLSQVNQPSPSTDQTLSVLNKLEQDILYLIGAAKERL